MKKSRQKTWLPELEKQVCARVREARQYLGYTQVEFAKQIDITRASLASYEEGRVALRLYVGLRICRQFIVGEKWLATGEGDWRGLLDLRHEHKVLDLHLSPLLPYGEAYAKLSPIYEDILDGQGDFRVVLSETEGRQFLENLFAYSVSRWEEELQPIDAVNLVRELLKVGNRLAQSLRCGFKPVFTERIWREIVPEYAAAARAVENTDEEDAAVAAEAARSARAEKQWPSALTEERGGSVAICASSSEPHQSLMQKDNLTGYPGSETVPPVKIAMNSWPALRTELNHLTSERGSKVLLARRFDVTPQAVSDWLREVYSPEADTVLKLLRFVESGEAAKLLSPTAAPAAAEANSKPSTAPKSPVKKRAKKR